MADEVGTQMSIINDSEERPLERMNTVDIIDVAESKNETEAKRIELIIQDRILRDCSPEAKMGRRKMLIRAVYGEFVCTVLFYCTIFCTIANGTQSGWTSEQLTLASAFVAGFQAIGICFAFSSMSGAQFNSAISFALWLTGKLSNRRALLYILVQLLASIASMILVSCMFSGNQQNLYAAIAVQPPNGRFLGHIFATEFFLTFFLTYIAFTVAFEDAEKSKKDNMSFKTISDSKGLTLYATTPQSKTGFAPFSIGELEFILFACLIFWCCFVP